MRFIGKILLIVTGVLHCCAESKVYTLDEILNTGMKNSRSIKIIEQEMYKSESEVQEIYGRALPAANASVNMSHKFSPAEITPSITSQNQLVNEMQNAIAAMMKPKESSAAFNIGVEQPIFAQGKIYFGLKLANKKRVTLNCKIQDEKQKVRGNIVKLYFGGLMAQRNVQIAFEHLKIATETHRIVLLRESIGTASEYDTLSSRLHKKNAQISYTNSESELRLAYDKILSASGLHVSLSTFELYDSVPANEFSLSIDQVIDQVKKNNFSITQISGYREMYNYQVKLAVSDFMPLIYCGGSFGQIGQFDGIDDIGNLIWSDDRKVYIGAKWDIFTGTARKEKIFQANVDRDIFELNSEQLVDNLVLETKRAYEKYITSKNQLDATDEVVWLAERGLTLARASYEAGSKIYLDMQNAELELQKAKMQHNSARYTYYCAVVDLQILMGNLLF